MYPTAGHGPGAELLELKLFRWNFFFYLDQVFYPFTRPVLYGKQEDLAFQEGPSLQARSYNH